MTDQLRSQVDLRVADCLWCGGSGMDEEHTCFNRDGKGFDFHKPDCPYPDTYKECTCQTEAY